MEDSVTEGVFTALSAAPNLKAIGIGDQDMSLKTMEMLRNILKNTKSLEHLEFYDVSFPKDPNNKSRDSEFLRLLGDGLEQNSSLKTLEIICDFQDDDMELLVEKPMSSSANLEKLDISYSDVGIKTLYKLRTLLDMPQCSLQYLDISGSSRTSTPDDVTPLAMALMNNRLLPEILAARRDSIQETWEQAHTTELREQQWQAMNQLNELAGAIDHECRKYTG